MTPPSLHLHTTLRACFRRTIWPLVGNPPLSKALLTWCTQRCPDRRSSSTLAFSQAPHRSRFPRSGCWPPAGPGGFLTRSNNLRLRLWRSPAFLDVGDTEDGSAIGGSRFHAFLSFPKQSRPIYPPARSYPGRYHQSSNRLVTPSDVRTPTILKWSANH